MQGAAVLGPDGFHFSDFSRPGLPTNILVIAVSIRMLLRVWPLKKTRACITLFGMEP